MDDELNRIREKKIREIQERIEEKNRNPGVFILDQERFAQAIADHPALVVDFWAEWCGPCRMVGPAVEELALEFGGRISFAKCNTDENQQLAGRLGISAIPTIMMFSRGQLVDRLIGAYPKDILRQRITRTFGIQTGD